MSQTGALVLASQKLCGNALTVQCSQCCGQGLYRSLVPFLAYSATEKWPLASELVQ